MPFIVLARHGKPVWDFITPVAGRDYCNWLAGMDDAPIDAFFPPAPELRRLARQSQLVASPLRRSLESAALLDPEAIPFVDPMFREVFTPDPPRVGIKLPPRLWTLQSRARWFSGVSPGVEGVQQARERAARAAETLDQLARAGEQAGLLLIAHGQMNGLIARKLRRLGWSGPWLRPRRYWAYARFELS